MTTSQQQYCLRWNNHRSNLLTVFDELLQSESFTDVTLACEGGSPIKCHRMVLAACSPYFQNIFTDLPCHHPVVVLKDVKYSEIKAILEYMYRGEVNVAQDQLAALLKVAEALKVKGLVEENRSCKSPPPREEPVLDNSPSISTSTPTIQNPVHSSSNSPPHSTPNILYKNPYHLYERKPPEHNPRMPNLPMWAVPGLPLPPHTASVPSQSHPHAAATAAAAMLSSAYEGVSSDMSPLKRKKLSSLLMQRDTPILRTVLGQGQADSSQPVSLVCQSDSGDQHSGGEDMMTKYLKNEPSEDAQSPYTDFTERMNDEEDKSKLAIPSSSPQSFSHDMRTCVASGIATYVPAQRQEYKRYKQYTRDEIMAAIDAVRNGMSALQAARKYKVPSRTLYDKVKKLGITTSRPFKRGSNGSSNCFPYGHGSPYGGHMSEGEENINNNSALLEASTFLQHALDSGGGDGREALAAMAAVAAAHAASSGHSTSPNNHGQARSPSPSPTMLKYMRHSSLTPSPAPGSDHHHSDQTNGSSERDRDDEEDHVEDLSINRKHEMIETRVIMPPMNVSAIIKKEEMLIDSIKEEVRMEMRLESEAD
ncbi:uncharacterized protein LOC132705050 [Cylas formicarius]|uniref:uncharacterized protein LOC132705050 n=1 Tax=Cylas formicarius TaxID=197179 RepID=UPI002958D1D2|nr:uncharacterized protein LOC132705050 [Cylas formicarius]XP_060531457.1 uncharacterized protein LOC132705050 [Cylas formicarius]